MKKLVILFLILVSVVFTAEKKVVNAGIKNNPKNLKVIKKASLSNSFSNAMMPRHANSSAKVSVEGVENMQMQNMASQGKPSKSPLPPPMDVVTGTVTTAYGAR